MIEVKYPFKDNVCSNIYTGNRANSLVFFILFYFFLKSYTFKRGMQPIIILRHYALAL